jgi:ribonuclease Z
VSARELVVLGTASQVPTARRNHNAYVLRWDGTTILFDPGEGTQRQMLLAGVTAPSVDRICITHAHGDHCLGLPGVLLRRAVDEAVTPVVLHYPEPSGAEIAVLRRAGLPAGAVAACVEVPVAVSEDLGVVATGPAGRWRLLAAGLHHRIPVVGYRLEEPDGVSLLPDRLAAAGVGGPDVGRLQREGQVRVRGGVVRLEDVGTPRRGQAFAFVMDTRPTPAAVALARGADVVVAESTYLERDADLAAAYGHLTARQAGELAAEAGASRLVLTHFSRRYGDDAEVFAREAREVFGDVVAVDDLDVVPLPPRRGRAVTPPGR